MTKVTQIIGGKLNIIERLKSSVNGNPRYSFVIVDSEGNLSPLIKTKPDSSYSYSITNYRDKSVAVEVSMYHGSLSLVSIIE